MHCARGRQPLPRSPRKVRWQRGPSIGSGLCQSICHTLLSLKLSKRRKAAQAQASQAFRAHPPISHGCVTAQVIINVNGCVSLLELPVSCMLSQEAAKKGKDAMLNEHERHQIELNSMRQSSRKQHQKLKELLPALLAPWHQHCCRRRDLERAYRNKAASLHPDKRGCHEAFCGLHSCA